jgi:hypothetical protein
MLWVLVMALLLGSHSGRTVASSNVANIQYGSRVCNSWIFLLIHGAGWVGGRKEGMGAECSFFSEHGILAASVEYRLADGSIQPAWPARMIGAQLAVRWLRANAERLPIPVNLHHRFFSERMI